VPGVEPVPVPGPLVQVDAKRCPDLATPLSDPVIEVFAEDSTGLAATRQNHVGQLRRLPRTLVGIAGVPASLRSAQWRPTRTTPVVIARRIVD
jgi:hypothetical protein